MVEINAAFADILGYGPEGLPYAGPHPWWPEPGRRSGGPPPGQRGIRPAHGQSQGSFVAPVTHRDGRRLWVAASFNEVAGPGHRPAMVVGTLRDITAEHYAGQREAALAAHGPAAVPGGQPAARPCRAR